MFLVVIVAIVCFFLVVELKSQFRYSLARILSPSSSISIVLLCFVLINRMLKCRWIRISPIWENLDKLSFGIYITHPWFMNVVTANKSVLVIAREHYIIFPIILFVFALFISIIISKILLRTKIGRFLIG